MNNYFNKVLYFALIVFFSVSLYCQVNLPSKMEIDFGDGTPVLIVDPDRTDWKTTYVPSGGKVKEVLYLDESPWVLNGKLMSWYDQETGICHVYQKDPSKCTLKEKVFHDSNDFSEEKTELGDVFSSVSTIPKDQNEESESILPLKYRFKIYHPFVYQEEDLNNIEDIIDETENTVIEEENREEYLRNRFKFSFGKKNFVFFSFEEPSDRIGDDNPDGIDYTILNKKWTFKLFGSANEGGDKNKPKYEEFFFGDATYLPENCLFLPSSYSDTYDTDKYRTRVDLRLDYSISTPTDKAKAGYSRNLKTSRSYFVEYKDCQIWVEDGMPPYKIELIREDEDKGTNKLSAFMKTGEYFQNIKFDIYDKNPNLSWDKEYYNSIKDDYENKIDLPESKRKLKNRSFVEFGTIPNIFRNLEENQGFRCDEVVECKLTDGDEDDWRKRGTKTTVQFKKLFRIPLDTIGIVKPKIIAYDGFGKDGKGNPCEYADDSDSRLMIIDDRAPNVYICIEDTSNKKFWFPNFNNDEELEGLTPNEQNFVSVNSNGSNDFPFKVNLLYDNSMNYEITLNEALFEDARYLVHVLVSDNVSRGALYSQNGYNAPSSEHIKDNNIKGVKYELLESGSVKEEKELLVSFVQKEDDQTTAEPVLEKIDYYNKSKEDAFYFQLPENEEIEKLYSQSNNNGMYFPRNFTVFEPIVLFWRNPVDDVELRIHSEDGNVNEDELLDVIKKPNRRSIHLKFRVADTQMRKY